MTRLIAFNGLMGSGKSTAVKLLKDSSLETPVRLVKFADPMYDMQEYAYRRIAKVYPRPADFTKDRKLLQWLGTEWGRSISPTLWVDLWRTEVAYWNTYENDADNSLVVTDDCRFDNEAEAVHSLGGVIISIIRHNSATYADGGTGISAHASESGISAHLIDHTVMNDGDLKEFEASLCKLFKALGVGKGDVAA